MGREKKQFREIQKLLPEGREEKARELGAFQRGREIKTAEELLRLILLYLTEGKSLAGTSAITNLTGEAEQVLGLYRTRRQIEIAFKRLKSVVLQGTWEGMGN